MFDQRGIGYSTPSLKCTELKPLQDASLSGANYNQTYEQAAQTCYNRLVSQGIDLNGFNSIQNAGDVNDVIHALGYKQMTLYGVSYGTRLALTTMRLYPAAVHAVVLDSTYPPDHNRNELPSDAQRVFNTFFQGCAKDTNCNTAYPNLQNTFYSLVDTLNSQPITFDTADPTTGQQYTVTFGGDDLVGFLFSGLYVTQLIPDLPKLILQIKAHDYTQFSTIYGALTFDDSFSEGMFYSTECSEDWPYLTQQDITTSEQGIDPHITKVFGQADEEQEYSICQLWKVQKAPVAQKQPVVSSIPTLVLAGEYDPITPPANGQDAAKTLSHSYFFQFPGQGHGQEYSSTCSDTIINAFEDNSSQQPDGSCISQMSEPAFQ
jgi:pimeloyl-ACP methyl ester carboxylesterase